MTTPLENQIVDGAPPVVEKEVHAASYNSIGMLGP
jgi:hypothetical protein